MQTFFLDPLRLADQVQPGVAGTAAVAFTRDEDGKLRACNMTDTAGGRHKGWIQVGDTSKQQSPSWLYPTRNSQSQCLLAQRG